MSERLLETAPTRASETILPWVQRLHDAHPVAPWKIGVAIFAFLTLAFFGSEIALGRYEVAREAPAGTDPFRNVRLALMIFLAIGYLVAACLYQVRTSRRTMAELVPMLGLPADEAARLVAAPGRVTRTVMWRTGVIALVLSQTIPLLADPWQFVFLPANWTVEMWWHRILVPVLCWWVVRQGGLVLTQSARLNALAKRLPELDLFDPHPLEPFTRQGLRHVAQALGLLGCFLVLFGEEGFGMLIVVLVGIGLATATVGLLLPLRGVRTRILAAKAEALGRCRGQLQDAAEALERGEGVAGRMADLAAWEARIEAVREWPIGGAAVSRLLLYLLIPIGSWVGGAFVERAVDSALR